MSTRYIKFVFRFALIIILCLVVKTNPQGRKSDTDKHREIVQQWAQVVRGKFINIFRQKSDGLWKIARRIRNLDHAPQSLK
jgi:hypothetical protein